MKILKKAIVNILLMCLSAGLLYGIILGIGGLVGWIISKAS